MRTSSFVSDLRAGSLVGRARLLHRRGREFESLPVHSALAPFLFSVSFWFYRFSKPSSKRGFTKTIRFKRLFDK
jgi:hypothetical protein